jgi:hypothetical protein
MLISDTTNKGKGGMEAKVAGGSEQLSRLALRDDVMFVE